MSGRSVSLEQLRALVEEYAGPPPSFDDVNRARRLHAATLAAASVLVHGQLVDASDMFAEPGYEPAVDDDTTDPQLDHRARHRDVVEASTWLADHLEQIAREDP